MVKARRKKFQLPSRRSAGKIKSRRANLEVVTTVKPRRCTDGAIGAFRGDEAFGSSSWRNLTCVDIAMSGGKYRIDAAGCNTPR